MKTKIALVFLLTLSSLSGFAQSNWSTPVNYATPTVTNNSEGTSYGVAAYFTTPAISTPQGTGTSGDPYLISNLTELYWIAASSSRWAAYYKQTANIDASSTSSWDSGAGWTTIGDDVSDFTGTYDGQGHTITGLYVNRSARDYVGLFGSIDGATIKNIGLINASVTGNNYVGALVGYSYSTTSTISNCFSKGAVSGANYAGGLIGYSDNPSGFIVSNCYSHCSVASGQNAGGLISDINNTGTITNCYSIGNVSGSGDTGGLIGLCNGSVLNCFWNQQTAGQATSAGGTSKTTAEMKTQSTYTNASWDFTTTPVWKIDGTNNSGYPYLAWQNYATAPTVTTQAVSVIGSTSATGNGDITATGGANITERGIYWSLTDGFADGAGIKVSTIGDWSATGTFTQEITGLTANTTYYVKAFATNSVGTSYGSQVSFATSIETNVENPSLTTLSIYPNPAHDILYINTGTSSKTGTNYSIKIVNTLGQTVFENVINNQLLSVDVSTLGANGIYFIQLIDQNGEIRDINKFIRE